MSQRSDAPSASESAGSRDFLAGRPWTSSYDSSVPADLELPETSLSHMFDDAVETYGSAVALDFFGATTTYAQLGARVAECAQGLLRLGVSAGDRVAIALPNCPAHVVAFYAVLRLGAVVVEHNPQYTAEELAIQFEDHGAQVAIVWDKAVGCVADLPEQVRPQHILTVDITASLPWRMRALLALPLPAARRQRAELTASTDRGVPFTSLFGHGRLDPHRPRPMAQDLALLQYTSGTTGQAKGAMLTHRNLESNAIMGRLWVHSGTDEVVYGALPLFHTFGLTLGMTFAISMGATLVLFPTPRPDLILGAIKRRRATIFPAVPPVYQRVLEEAQRKGVSLEGIGSAVSGAMALPVPLVQTWEDVTGGMLVEGYGLTECSPLVSCNPLNGTRRAGSIGVPFPSTDIRLVDPETLEDVARGEAGELWVRGPQVFQGYWNLPEATESTLSEGWLRTGDICEVDDDGFLSVVDRLKEIIITGGFNVAPSEVEDVLRGDDSVGEVAVVGLRQEDGGERVVAAVVAAEGASIDPKALRDRCYAHLARYKVPREVVEVEDIPMTMLGKVQRRQVREQLEEQRSRE